MTDAPYQPPESAEMLRRQNSDDALRLLIAQRRLYSKSKRWLGVRWLGMVAIGLAAPVMAVIWPRYAVAAGAVAGLWIFLGRTALVILQGSMSTRAAAIQEQFDVLVFGMPGDTRRSSLPSLEEISRLAGRDDRIQSTAREKRLVDWYPIDAADSAVVSVAICQRANVSYTDRLLRSTAIAWSVATAAWVCALVLLSAIHQISLGTFLLGIALPVLPAFLDVLQYVLAVRRSARDRADLAREIERQLEETIGQLNSSDLLVWQSRIYDLRRAVPEIPDFLYWLRRRLNERTMVSAARQLGRRSR